MMRILLGDISSYKAIVVAKFLKENYENIEIYSFDSHKFTNNIRSKYSDKHIIIDPVDIEGYANFITKNQIDYFIPVINENIKTILQNRVNFGNCLDYLGDFEIFEKLNNKKLLMSLAKELKIKIPKTYKNINDAKYPCVIKPTNLSSAKGVNYINNQVSLDKAKNKYYNQENIFAQEYIKGIGVGFSVYANNGEILSGYGHKRLAEYPITGGSSVYRCSYHDNRMLEIAEKLLEEWTWTGFAMFEFKLTPNNELYLIEVNPRIWGSINQGLQNGVNYFESMFGKIMKQNTTKVKTYLSPFFYYALLKYLFKLDFKHLYDFIKNRHYNKPDVNAWDDPKGYLSLILRKLL